MGRVAYTVTATLPDEQTRRKYEAWLLHGHIQAVIAGGATSGQVIRLTEPPLQVQSRYEFESQEAFARYVQNHAPRLRAEGQAKFGPDSGVTFRREVGTILE